MTFKTLEFAIMISDLILIKVVFQRHPPPSSPPQACKEVKIISSVGSHEVTHVDGGTEQLEA